MPPALVLTCEFEPLLDVGVAYADAFAAGRFLANGGGALAGGVFKAVRSPTPA
jgi:hypothetical protein